MDELNVVFYAFCAALVVAALLWMRRRRQRGSSADQYHPFRSEAAKSEYLISYDKQAMRWPISGETRYVDTSYGETFVRVQGPADGPPLLLLPGDSENSLAWIPVIRALSETCRTYAPDQIYDCGRSVYRREIRGKNDFIEWLDELRAGLDLMNVRLIGHSYGGWLATLYALSHPERVEKLVLLSPSATILPPPPGLLLRAILYYLFPFRCVVKRYLYWYAPDAVRKPETRSAIDAMIEEDLLARRCFKRRRFVMPTVLSDKDWGSLRIPTLFLIGENEVTYAADEAVRRLGAVAPAVRTATAEGGDHHLTIIDPDWVSDHVLAFLDAPQIQGQKQQLERPAVQID